MQLPSLNTLRTFEAAARHQSFLLAAEELNITPSAVSHQIRQLENTLTVKLFERSARQVSLSRKGDQYYTQVQQALQILSRATSSLAGPSRDRQIRMSVVPFFATRWLMPRIDRFQAAHSGWELAIQTSTQRSDFDREDLDLVIRRGGGTWRGLSSTLLLEEELIAVAAPSIANGANNLTQLKTLPLLYNSQVPSEWREWFAALGQEFTPSGTRLELQNNSQILEACVTGIGVALIDRQLIGEELTQGRIQPVTPLSVRGMRNYFLAYPKEHAKRPAVKLFQSWLQNELKL
ncbi:LysR substrate-binding domain-containing protein [Polycladidibacter hongkongensis]|uniref:LysR substrate-binding domain-containing protein n=1 Tax=Polycladidibacter hongkongensis TaxID=1647556 RepID=UPI00082965F8|nr:LysR substrate-binding domain-containing protein [Pseudovibrio hongkongensis]